MGSPSRASTDAAPPREARASDAPSDDDGEARNAAKRARDDGDEEDAKTRDEDDDEDAVVDDDDVRANGDAAHAREADDAGDDAGDDVSPRAEKRAKGDDDDAKDVDDAAKDVQPKDANAAGDAAAANDDDAAAEGGGDDDEIVGEDPAVVAARNAAARGPSEEEIEAARAAERLRVEIEARENAIVTRSIDCPASMVGRIIGKGGETIKGLQAQSGAHVAIDQNIVEGEPRKINISGVAKCVDVAANLVENLLLGTGPGSGLLIAPGQISKLVECPKEAVGKLIGRGGETIRGIQMATGARMQIDQTRQPCQVVMAGSDACVAACVQVVQDIIDGGSTAIFNEYARGGSGFGGQHFGAAAPQPLVGWAHAPSAPYGAMAYANPYAAYGAAQYPYADATAALAVPAPALAAPAIWRAVDDGKGNTYYYNTRTGASQWDKPQDMPAT